MYFDDILASRFRMSSSSSTVVPPVTELTDSEDEGAKPDQPQLPRKRRRVGPQSGASNSHGSNRSVSSLFNQLCQCSKERKPPNTTCFLKFKDDPGVLERARSQFQSLHKLDQDQWETMLYSVYFFIVSGIKVKLVNSQTLLLSISYLPQPRYLSASSMERWQIRAVQPLGLRGMWSREWMFAELPGNPSSGLELGVVSQHVFLFY